MYRKIYYTAIAAVAIWATLYCIAHLDLDEHSRSLSARYWHDILQKIQRDSTKLKQENIVVINVGSLEYSMEPKIRNLTLTRLFAAINYSEPAVVGIVGFLYQDTSLIRILSSSRVVADVPTEWHFMGNVYNSKVLLSIRYNNDNSIYYPVTPGSVKDTFFLDFGLTVAIAYQGNRPDEIRYRYLPERGEVVVQGKIIPIDYSQRYSKGHPISMIKYVNNYKWAYFFPLAEFSENAPRDTIVSTGILGDPNKSIFSLSNKKSQYPYFNDDILGRRYKGKIVLINIDYDATDIASNNNFSEYYANVITNYLDNNFVMTLNEKYSRLLMYIFVIGVVLSFYYARALYSLLATSALVILLLASSIILFSEGNFFFNPFIFAFPFILLNVLLLPFEIIHDRIKILDTKKRLEAELESARSIQKKLLPVEDPKIPGYDIHGTTIPAHEVGGDFYDYIWLNQEKSKMGIAIADVSGKAMGAAMTAVMTSGMVYSETSKNSSPKEILGNINRPLYIKTEKNVFTAMLFAVIDVRKKTLRISNAGQVFPLLLHNGKAEYLRIKGPRFPLGMMENVLYDEEEIQLHTGDVVLLYTDGISEAMNNKKELFGFERLEKELQNTSLDHSAQQLSEQINKALHAFTSGAEQHDDMTMVVIKVI